MKKILLMAFAAAAFTSCSDDEGSNGPSENQMTLKKIETFRPTQAEYESGTSTGNATRSVSYYQNNRIVADTLFGIDGSPQEYSTYTYSPTTHTYSAYTHDNQLKEQRILTIDSQGRVTNAVTSFPSVIIQNGQGTLAGQVEYTYFYSGNTITSTRLNSNWIPQVYQVNSTGVISILPGSPANTLNISGDKLTGFQPPQGDYFTFNYYTNPMPQNLVKTPTELNNIILLTYHSAIAEQGNYYLQSHSYVTYTKQFNALNYLVTDKAVTTDAASYGPTYYDESAYESFYYYN